MSNCRICYFCQLLNQGDLSSLVSAKLSLIFEYQKVRQSMNATFLYEVIELEERSNEFLRCFFEELSVDPYIEGSYRRRAYSRYHLKSSKVERRPHRPFQQGYENKLFAVVSRNYPPLELKIDLIPAFYHLLDEFAKRTRIDPNKDFIDVHQIRIVCGSDCNALPAPEGIHQDGFRFVGIYCVQRQNVDGGFTEIYSEPNGEALIHSILQENQCIILNDKRFYHYASAIISHDIHKIGSRDVFVLTT